VYFQIAWLQAYVAAISSWMFGESSWSARILFAFAGWLCVPLTGWAVRRAGADMRAARFAALLLALSVPFIVSSRQARYYPLTAALALLTTGACATLLDAAVQRNRSAFRESVLFLIAAVLLVVSFDVTAIGVLGMLAFYGLLMMWSHDLSWRREFWLPWGCAALVLAAWLMLSLSAPARSANAGLTTLPARIWHGSFFYLRVVNAYVVPLPLLLVTVAALWLRKGTAMPAQETAGNRKAVLLLTAVAVGGIGGAILVPHRFFRYIVPVFPLIVAIAGIAIASLWSLPRFGRIAAIAIVAGLVTSNVLFVWSHSLLTAMGRASGFVTVRQGPMNYRVPLALLRDELRDPPRGPIAAMVAYLREHATDNDVLVAMYGDLPLKFHTRLRIYGGETGQLPPAGTSVRWIWPRSLTVYPEIRPAADWIRQELSTGAYDRIELPVADRQWENREDPEDHVFSNPGPAAPPVVLYRLRAGAE
jgi:hypothetical protein